MAATIKIKNSSTAGAAPTASDLVQGELAVNVTDKRLYTENASGTIVELGTNPSVPVTFPDGSASAPSLTNDGDTNTGIFFPAADTVGIATGGTERARVDSSGNLGLGVTPSAQLASYKSFQFGIGGNLIGRSDNAGIELSSNAYRNTSGNYIYLNTDNAASYRHYNGQHQWFNAASGTAGNAISFTQAMTLDANGKLLVGGTTSDLSATTQAMIMGSGGFAVQYTGTTGTLLQVVPGAANGTVDFKADARSGNYPAMTFYTSATERARIDSSGNFLLGTTSVLGSGKFSLQFDNSSQNGFVFKATSTSYIYNVFSFRNSSGVEVGYVSTTGTTTTYSTSSDYRLKENIAPMTGALATVAQLKPCTYTWKADGSDGQGFIAHELQEVVPDCVTGAKDAVDADGNPKYQGIDTSFLVATLTAAIQELKAELDAAKARITALEA